MRGKGLGLICHFLKALRARGVPVLTDQQVESLAVEGERVTGVDHALGRAHRGTQGRDPRAPAATARTRR